jgi:hypothetical protein
MHTGFLVEKREGKRPLGDLVLDKSIVLTFILKEAGAWVLDRIHLTYAMDQ